MPYTVSPPGNMGEQGQLQLPKRQNPGLEVVAGLLFSVPTQVGKTHFNMVL